MLEGAPRVFLGTGEGVLWTGNFPIAFEDMVFIHIRLCVGHSHGQHRVCCTVAVRAKKQ